MKAYPCRPRVLIVDDAVENIQLLSDMLADCQLVTASNGVQALKLANDDPGPDLILLDIVMPGMNGYEVCTRLKSEQKTRDIPVIFLAELAEKHEERKGLELGGADYLTRPFSQHLVKTRIRHQLDIKRCRDHHEAALAQSAQGVQNTGLDLQLELSARKQVQEEFSNLNRTLEMQLCESRAQLAAAREELRLESQGSAEARLEIGLLRDDLARQKADLEMAGKELESLSFSISHDLRAPLRHILGFSGALREDYGDSLDESAQNFLRCINKAAHQMESQIEALLGLSRIGRQQLTLASVDLSQMVRERAASLQGTAPRRRVQFTIADQLRVRADAALLQAAIDHLLGNAWKFTRGKEVATIEFGRNTEKDGAVFFLRDNGAGFDMRYADRLFGAFQRMHKESEFEGTGIGLATVQRIIHRHGGRIRAEARVDAGATFFFTLSE